MRGQSTLQLRHKEMLHCVLLSPVILEELQEHSPYQPPHEMAQQVVHVTHVQDTCIYALFLFTTVAGADYVAVAGEELVFNRGDTQVCHTIDILQDNICESDPNEQFFSDLAYVSGVLPITISPPTARVVIDDRLEEECKHATCRKYKLPSHRTPNLLHLIYCPFLHSPN